MHVCIHVYIKRNMFAVRLKFACINYVCVYNSSSHNIKENIKAFRFISPMFAERDIFGDYLINFSDMDTEMYG